MNRDDALLSIERHATSKIASDQDLFNIRTLGSGVRPCRASPPCRNYPSSAGMPPPMPEPNSPSKAASSSTWRDRRAEGTLVTVRQLFFNTPARRKFLKSIATEMAHIADILASMALAWPQVQFRLTHNGKVVKNWPAAADPLSAPWTCSAAAAPRSARRRPIPERLAVTLDLQPQDLPQVLQRDLHPGEPPFRARPLAQHAFFRAIPSAW